jgi:hypothetical protein
MEIGPVPGDAAPDPERVDPKRLHLDRLADARRDHPVADLGVHPGELHAGHARREKAVFVHADAEARTMTIAMQDLLHGVRQPLCQSFVKPARSREKIVDGDDVPERGVDRVEFWLLAGVGKAVRKHAFGDRIGPGQQDVASEVEPAGQCHEAAQRYECVATPVGEPGIAGDDRLAAAALHDVGVGGALKG